MSRMFLWNVLWVMDNKSGFETRVWTMKCKAVTIVLMLECTDVHCCHMLTDVIISLFSQALHLQYTNTLLSSRALCK